MDYEILSPVQAASAANLNFFADFPLRKWGIAESVKRRTLSGECGELASLRFTWMRPKTQATDENTLLYRTLPWLLDAARWIAASPLQMLHITRTPGKLSLFALAMFENQVGAEFELNECLPDSLKPMYFLKANFSGGHVGNLPLIGYFNVEGSVLADDRSFDLVCSDPVEGLTAANEVELAALRFRLAVERGEISRGPLFAKEIISAIQGACDIHA